MCKNVSHTKASTLCCAIIIFLPNKDISVFNITALPLDIAFFFLTRLEKVFSLFFESGSWNFSQGGLLCSLSKLNCLYVFLSVL